MKILILIGSPRNNGNSSKVIDFISHHPMKDYFDLEAIYLSKLNIQPCKSCYMCNNMEKCIIEDDVSGIVNRMILADVILYVPVMHAFLTNGIFQNFLERSGFGFLRPMNRPLKGKIANVIVVGRKYFQSQAFNQVIANIYLNEMILIGCGFPSTINSLGEFPGDILLDQEGMDSINKMITSIVDFYNTMINPTKLKEVYDTNDR